MLMAIQTVYGELLIGEIIDHPPAEIFKGRSGLPPFDYSHGIWLKRKTHLSFIASDDITVKRRATKLDREITVKK